VHFPAELLRYVAERGRWAIRLDDGRTAAARPDQLAVLAAPGAWVPAPRTQAGGGTGGGCKTGGGCGTEGGCCGGGGGGACEAHDGVQRAACCGAGGAEAAPWSGNESQVVGARGCTLALLDTEREREREERESSFAAAVVSQSTA
jgi:hypothetical protein